MSEFNIRELLVGPVGGRLSVQTAPGKQGAAAPSPSCGSCTEISCQGCTNCTHCTGCTSCSSCTWCTGCSQCTGCSSCSDCSDCTSPTRICGFITSDDEISDADSIDQLDQLRRQLESLVQTVDMRRAELLSAKKEVLENEEQRLKNQLEAIRKFRDRSANRGDD